MNRQTFPARFEPDPDGGYVVTFRDIPEAITQGDTMEEAQSMAADALLTAMDFYFEDRRLVPAPSAAQPGEIMVSLPLSAAAKVELLNLVVAHKERPVDLARKMGIRPQEVTRLLDPKHATKIDTLAQAFRAQNMGVDLQVGREVAYVLDLRTSLNRATVASVSETNPRMVLVVPEDNLEEEPTRALAYVKPGDVYLTWAVFGNILPGALALSLRDVVLKDAAKRYGEPVNAS